MFKMLIVMALSLLSINSQAGITAEQILGEYWKDPLFGAAATEQTVLVDVSTGQVWPSEITVPVSKNIRFVFSNKSSESHLFAFTQDVDVLLKNEEFIKFVKDELYHSQQTVNTSSGHSHSGTSVNDAEAIVKKLSQRPTVFIKPDDLKEILIRFDEPIKLNFTCVLDPHEDKPYTGIINVR
jgi:uncharacterized cupredoxin-like copper-binding protein